MASFADRDEPHFGQVLGPARLWRDIGRDIAEVVAQAVVPVVEEE